MALTPLEGGTGGGTVQTSKQVAPGALHGRRKLVILSHSIPAGEN